VDLQGGAQIRDEPLRWAVRDSVRSQGCAPIVAVGSVSIKALVHRLGRDPIRSPAPPAFKASSTQ
jgi:hypothetical protein